MLEASIYSAYPRAFLGDSAYRCRRCGGSPVMGSDGFLMDHCMNCGNWQSAVEPLSIGFGVAKRKIVSLFKKTRARLRRRLSAEPASALSTEPTLNPCA